MEFESPPERRRGFEWSLPGRVELEPWWEVDCDQGDFGSDSLRFAVAAAAYRWSNDGSQNRYTENGRSTREDVADLDRSHGVEVSGALRGRGLSADAEIQWVRGETTDRAFTGGLYDRGEAELSKLSLQSGYMVLPERVEIVGGYDRLDAATLRGRLEETLPRRDVLLEAPAAQTPVQLVKCNPDAPKPHGFERTFHSTDLLEAILVLQVVECLDDLSGPERGKLIEFVTEVGHLIGMVFR